MGFPRLVPALACLLCCIVVAEAQNAPAVPQWAVDINALLGGTSSPPSATYVDPNALLVTGVAADPASGIRILSGTEGAAAAAASASAHSYIWTGPVSAGADTLPFVQAHPYSAVALQTLAFMQLMKVVEAKKELHPHPPIPRPPVPEFFVQVSQGQFISGTQLGAGQCTTLHPAGLNKYELVEAGAGAPRLFDAQLTRPGLRGPRAVRDVLDQAAASGLNLLRMNAFAVDTQYSVAQQVGGTVTYNEGVLQGLDYVLDQARLRGMRVLLTLTDYFADGAGGPLQYLQFAGVDVNNPSDELKAQFFTNGQAQALFQQYISLLVGRVNTVNGRTYKSDPTIFGWDVMNEPRCASTVPSCQPDGPSAIDTFAADTSAYIKSLDSIHLVTIGLDGFYQNAPGVYQNPFTSAADYGTDWVATTSAPSLDFGMFNVYPDIYGNVTVSWVDGWTAQHLSDAQSPLGKPALIKEFGMQPTDQRTPFYGHILAAATSAIQSAHNAVGGLVGGMYFQGWVDGTSAVWWTLAQGGRFGILPSVDKAVYSQLVDFAATTAGLDTTIACPNNPYLAPTFPPQPNCLPGWEGPDCSVDVNECVRGLDDCDVNAACINTVGGFTCRCFETYLGNGRICLPDPLAQAVVAASFFTNNQVNGFPGSVDIEYPHTAPGWIDDPTGYYPPTGSRLNVTLLQCEIACNTAGVTACTSFFYDAVSQSCFLKAQECPLVDEVPPVEDVCSYPVYVDNQASPVGTATFVCSRGITYYRSGIKLPAGCVAPA